MKFSIFMDEKKLCILYGQGFVMIKRKGGFKTPSQQGVLIFQVLKNEGERETAT